VASITTGSAVWTGSCGSRHPTRFGSSICAPARNTPTGSRSFRQPRDAFGGNAFFTDYSHLGRHWFWRAVYEDRDPEFRADSGFIPRVDVRTVRGTLLRQFWGGADDWFTLISVGGTGDRTEDHDGTLTDRSGELFATVNGPLQSVIGGSISRQT